jgi:hypothetical protein
VEGENVTKNIILKLYKLLESHKMLQKKQSTIRGLRGRRHSRSHEADDIGVNIFRR